MSEEKKTLQIELLQLDISKFTAPRESRHVATVELIWPRVQVASRTALKTLVLNKGKSDLRNSSWLQRILFKEGVEYDFGLLFKVSQSMTSAAFDEFMRYVAERTAADGSDLLKLFAPGVVGEAGVVFLLKVFAIALKSNEHLFPGEEMDGVIRRIAHLVVGPDHIPHGKYVTPPDAGIRKVLDTEFVHHEFRRRLPVLIVLVQIPVIADIHPAVRKETGGREMRHQVLLFGDHHGFPRVQEGAPILLAADRGRSKKKGKQRQND